MITALLTVVAWASVFLQTPIAGQPITFAADHDGQCAGTWSSCAVSYQLYINGVKVGSELPASANVSGVVKFTINGLAAGSYTVEVTAIARGTLADGTVANAESNRSAPLAVVVDPAPLPDIPLLPPVNVRVEPVPIPPDLGDSVIDRQTDWVLDTNGVVAIPVTVNVGQTVLLASFQTASGARTYTASASDGMPLTLIGTAHVPGTSRGVMLWKGSPTTAGTVTFTVRANLDVSVRASVLLLNTEELDAQPWVEVESLDSQTHACGPTPWPVTHDGYTLCLIGLNSGSRVALLDNAVWIPPTTGSTLGGWIARSVGETQDGQVRFSTNDARHAFKIALRVW